MCIGIEFVVFITTSSCAWGECLAWVSRGLWNNPTTSGARMAVLILTSTHRLWLKRGYKGKLCLGGACSGFV
jgi:hypothetical protein